MNSDSIRLQPPSSAEIRELFERYAVARSDAAAIGQSWDGRYVDAYTAGFLLAKIAVRAAGYRVTGADNHWETIRMARSLLGRDLNSEFDAIELSRRRRNESLYDGAGLVDGEDVAALLTRVDTLESALRAWLSEHHPYLL